jgi:predicted transcriptional regulator
LSEESLSEIKILLQEIKDLLLFINQDKIEERKLNLLEPNSVEEKIYNLCNGENSISDIANKIHKKNNNVKAVLSNLRKKGLIRTTTTENKTAYQKNF